LARLKIRIAVVFVVACTQADPITWGEAQPVSFAVTDTSGLAFDSSGQVVAPRSVLALPPATPRQCRETVRVARTSQGGKAGETYAVWWAARADSTADVVVAHTPDGAHWSSPAIVDTLDAGRTGCRRPPPSIAADGDNVYVAYAMAAREGPGIFASHSMDRGVTFHSPVPVVYGSNIGRSAIAAHGNIVVVAYEDPNSSPERVALAFSRTMGHPFDSRMIVSPPTGVARDPRVALAPDARRIAVVWEQQTSDSATAGARLMRVGQVADSR
jgi:hypothetical protein